jgi:hypothetical protein
VILRWDIFAVFETESPEIGGAASVPPVVFGRARLSVFRLEKFDEISRTMGHPNLRAAQPAYVVVATEFYALGAKMCRLCFDIGDLQLNAIPTARCRLRAIGHGLPSGASWTTLLGRQLQRSCHRLHLWLISFSLETVHLRRDFEEDAMSPLIFSDI